MEQVRLNLEKLPSSNADHSVMRMNGKLSLETVHNFIQTLRPEPAAHLVLDMSGVLFVDSSGVGALVSLFVSRRGQGKKFALAALRQQGIAVLEVSGLQNLLPIYSSVEEALTPRT